MNVFYDIIIPFLVGIFGIYIAYMTFELFLKVSFRFAYSVKEDFGKKKTALGKILTVMVLLIVAVGTIVLIATFIYSEEYISKKIVARIFFCIIGFALFVMFFNSPLHEKFKDSDDN